MLALTFSDLNLPPFGLLFIKENDLFTVYSIQREIQAFVTLQKTRTGPSASGSSTHSSQHGSSTWQTLNEYLEKERINEALIAWFVSLNTWEGNKEQNYLGLQYGFYSKEIS